MRLIGAQTRGRAGLWKASVLSGTTVFGSGVRELRAAGAAGRLAPELRAALRHEPALLGRMARVLLDLHFPPSLHGDLCESVGLALELEPAEARELSGLTGPLSARVRRATDRRGRSRSPRPTRFSSRPSSTAGVSRAPRPWSSPPRKHPDRPRRPPRPRGVVSDSGSSGGSGSSGRLIRNRKKQTLLTTSCLSWNSAAQQRSAPRQAGRT